VKLFRSWPGILMTVFNTSATVVFLLCEISPKYEKLKKKKEYSMEYSPLN
jgi:hypothetical protein